MQPGEPRLAIDYGHTTTVAVVAWPDGRWLCLTFDGGAVLSSAVHVGSGGGWLTGVAAWRQAAAEPDRFVASPLRAGTGIVIVDGTGVEVQDLVVATLKRVAGAAAEAVGAPVTDVRMVYPAGWGPRRRTWLRQAAYRAGLGQPRLVEAPVAAADRLLAAGGQVPVGAFLLVCDVGAGFEATVLRRGPTGFEVLSTRADPDAAGDRIDELLLASVPGPEVSAGGPESVEVGADGARWTATASLRAAKESLSRQVAVTVPLPPPALPLVLSSAVLEEVARPVLKRAAALAAEVVAAAEITPEQLAGVHCIGAGSAAPAIAQALQDQLGVTPVVAPDPGFAAVYGAAQAGGDGIRPGEAPAPAPRVPVRRWVALAVPWLTSLALYVQFLLTASFNNGTPANPRPHYYVLANWGELAMAAVFAMLCCLAAGSLFGAGLAGAYDRGRPSSPGAQIGAGILAAAAAGMAIAGLYAVFGALYLAVPVGPLLRWTLYPTVPIAALAAAVAFLAARQGRVPVQGWDAYLAFPMGSVLAGAAGMVLLQYSMTATHWPQWAFWIDAAGHAGGLLLGVGAAFAVVNALVLRLIVAAPLAVFMAATVSWRSTGVLAVIFAVAVIVWWARRLWDLIRSPRQAPNPGTAAWRPT